MSLPSSDGTPRAFTFDLWNTLIVANADWADVREARLNHLADWLLSLGAARPRDEIADVYTAAQALADELQEAEQKTLDAAGLVARMTGQLGVDADDTARAALQELLEDALPQEPFHATDAVVEVLADLRARGVRLGLVSNLGWTPGRVMRREMARVGVLEFFDDEALAFSDEVGVVKPHPAIFERALTALGVAADEAVHVGDLKLTDVAGARALGMRTVRYAGVHDDPTDAPDADIVVADYRELPAAAGL
jgi:putative hydrolase of the HAD superfamily